MKNYVLSLVIGLSLHSVFDGIPLSSQMLNHANESVAYGISLHKIPEGFALVTVLLFSGFRKNITIILLFVFACYPSEKVLINLFLFLLLEDNEKNYQ